ncbi:MAG: DUF4252 domain-containing protein [Flavobacteriaceae bacterium]|nr:DUF4252 domain-containing protein [Flavobacteriaceae bacterium]
MKKIIIIAAIVLAPVMSFGQSIFDKFEDMEGVTSVVVNQKMFSMLANIEINTDDAETQEYIDMIKNISSLKVLTTGDAKIAAEMNAKVDSYLASSSLDELMRIKDGDQTVKFYVREGKDENHVKELLMFANGLKELTKDQDISINGQKREIETVLLTLVGDIDLRQVSKLTNKMNVPGGKHLEKAGNKNKN